MSKRLTISMTVLATVILNALFIGCGRPRNMPDQDTAMSKGNVDFTTLNEKIFSPKCMSCHASFTAHDSLLASGTIVPGKPEQSALYTKVASGLMPKNGTPLSPDEVTAIYNWISAGAMAENPSPGNPGIPGTVPPSSAISPTFAWVQAAVFTSRCVICHRGPGAPAGYDLSSYTSVSAGGRIVPGSPTASTLYNRINSNSMPPGGPALTAEQKQAIATWIQNGAKDDAPAGGVVVPPAPALPPLEPKYKSIAANIIGPRCLACHSSVNPSDGVVLMTYANLRRRVVPGNAGESDLYKVVEENEMPRSGGPLSFEQKETIRVWIQNGALDN